MATSLAFVPDYTINDTTKRTTVDTDFRNQYNLSQNQDVRNVALQTDLDAWSFPGHTKEQLSQIENVFSFARDQYIAETAGMKVFNNLSNVSQYVNDSVTKEYDRIVNLKDKSFSDVHKMRQHYLYNQYQVHYNRFWTGVIQFTFFVVAVCGYIALFMIKPDNPLSIRLGMFIISGVLTFYVLVAILYYRDTRNRRKDDWNKFYFKGMDKNSSLSCKR